METIEHIEEVAPAFAAIIGEEQESRRKVECKEGYSYRMLNEGIGRKYYHTIPRLADGCDGEEEVQIYRAWSVSFAGMQEAIQERRK